MIRCMRQTISKPKNARKLFFKADPPHPHLHEYKNIMNEARTEAKKYYTGFTDEELYEKCVGNILMAMRIELELKKMLSEKDRKPEPRRYALPEPERR
jgi:hypothetical protein